MSKKYLLVPLTDVGLLSLEWPGCVVDEEELEKRCLRIWALPESEEPVGRRGIKILFSLAEKEDEWEKWIQDMPSCAGSVPAHFWEGFRTWLRRMPRK